MDKSDLIISKEKLEADGIACEAWLLPEVAGAHRVQGRESRSIKKNVVLAENGDEQGANEEAKEAPAVADVAADAAVVPETLGEFNEAMTLSKLRQLAESIQSEAYQTGFVSGQTEGFAKGEQQIAEQMEMLSQLIHSAKASVEQERESLQQSIEQIIKKIAEAFCAKAVKTDDSLIANAVQAALESLTPSDTKPVVYLAEFDYKLLEARGLLDSTIDWEIDPQLSTGGCRVAGAYGEVDNSFEHRLNGILEQLFPSQS